MVTHQKVTQYDYVAYFGCSFFVHFEPNNTFPQLLDSYVALFDLIGSPLDMMHFCAIECIRFQLLHAP